MIPACSSDYLSASRLAMIRTPKFLPSLAFCLAALAGVLPIGMATSDGDIEIGRVRMPGPATLYEGALVETANSPAQLSLRNGAVIRLGSGARATVGANSLLLERGVSQIDAPGDYAIHARSVTVIPTSHPSRARLQLSDDGALQIAAISGSFENQRAGVSSMVAAGRSLSFSADAAQAGAVAPPQFKGCLAKTGTTYLVRDESSKVIVALEGSSITGKPGDRVTVVGKPDAAAKPVHGASQVIQVLRVTVNGHGCSAKEVVAAAASVGAAGTAAAGVGAAAAGTAAGAAGVAAGISTAAIAGIGVAAAAAAIIPAVALTSGSSSSSSSVSPSSR